MESSVVLFKPRIHLFAGTHPSVSISLVCNDWLAYKHQSTALYKHVWMVVLVVYKHRLHPVFQTRLECGSLSAYTHYFPTLCFKHVLRRGVRTRGAVTASLMILLTPRPSFCVPGTGTQSFNRCFPSKRHTEDGPQIQFLGCLARFIFLVSDGFPDVLLSVVASVSSLVQTRLFLGRLFVYPPARTKRKVTPPTPELAETTASSIPRPTCAFDVTSGDCGATHNCITSPNYSENYTPDGSCVINLASLLTLDEKDFRTEVLWDTAVMN